MFVFICQYVVAGKFDDGFVIYSHVCFHSCVQIYVREGGLILVSCKDRKLWTAHLRNHLCLYFEIRLFFSADTKIPAWIQWDSLQSDSFVFSESLTMEEERLIGGSIKMSWMWRFGVFILAYQSPISNLAMLRGE